MSWLRNCLVAGGCFVCIGLSTIQHIESLLHLLNVETFAFESVLDWLNLLKSSLVFCREWLVEVFFPLLRDDQQDLTIWLACAKSTVGLISRRNQRLKTKPLLCPLRSGIVELCVA